MLEALIFLAAAVVVVPIAARLGLGSVLGYLIAGALIGPWGLRLIEDVDKTANLAELGVVLMLFVIGLELDPKRLLSMRNVVFGAGSLQLASCGVVLGLALWAVGLAWQAAVIGGLALALSSTAIAMQSMTERGDLETPTGRAGLRHPAFPGHRGDPLIGLVPFLGHVDKAGMPPMWQRLGIAVVAIVGVIVIGRYLTRPRCGSSRRRTCARSSRRSACCS
jgi:glutathione-regulated potassium-efflux system ancillary protein KefC